MTFAEPTAGLTTKKFGARPAAIAFVRRVASPSRSAAELPGDGLVNTMSFVSPVFVHVVPVYAAGSPALVRALMYAR